VPILDLPVSISHSLDRSMASGTNTPELDLRVKGSLPSGSAPPSTAGAPKPPPLPPSNPLDTAPSSPSQIYLNLLILEASLRSQYLIHLARRRKFTFFVVILFVWILFFSYRIFILGGSPYYYVSLLERLGFGGGVVTGVLYYATGLYHKTIIEPRRFVFMANRGLRGFNVKLVKIPLSTRGWISWWWAWYTYRPPHSLRHFSRGKRRQSTSTRRPTTPIPVHTHAPSLSSATLHRPLSTHREEEEEEEEIEEYLPGGLHLKLVILPKGFSPDFREGWELYRSEYWERENENRIVLRQELERRRKIKHEDNPPTTIVEKRIRRGSRSGSISSQRRTPTPEPDAGTTSRVRRGSTASLKRRSYTALRASTPGDVSDSGSTTSALGERDRMRRSESVRTDRSSSSTGSVAEGKRKTSGKGRGKKKTSGKSSSNTGGSDIGEGGGDIGT